MKNFFSEFNDVTLTFSDIQLDKNGMEFMRIYFERPCKIHFFDFIESRIPGFEVVASEGFSDNEIAFWLNYAMRNSFLMWDFSRKKVGFNFA